MSSDDLKRRVRDANDIQDVVRSYGVELKRAGRNVKACCPFHQEKTASFNVNPEGQYFKCFGCGESGDVYSFVMKIEGVGFPEALRILADRAGIPVEVDPQAIQRSKKEGDWKSYLYRLNQSAAALYRELLHSEAGAAARAYLEGRGIDEASWEAFGLGYAPEQGSPVTQRLLAQKAPVKALERAGLAGLRDDGSPYDYFRGRLMFPIHDSQQRVIGFGGRILGDGQPKYLNTRETPLFEKSRTIYGLPQARDAIVETKRAIVVEGYTDVIVCHQFGIRNVVACLGTALTADHARKLGRLADELLVLTDADEAGASAAERCLEMLFQEDVPARIARLEGQEKDPCEFLLAHGAEAFEAQLARSVPLFEYKFRRVAAAHDLADSAGQARAAKELMALVSLSPDPLRRAAFRREVAAKLNLPESALAFDAKRAPDAPRPAARAVQGAPAPEHALAHAERELLRWVFHQPAWLATAAHDVDLMNLAGAPERLVGRAIWEALDEGRLPPDDGTLGAEDRSAGGTVAREVLERLSASGGVAEGDATDGFDAAQRLCVDLAETGPEHQRLRLEEAYAMRLRSVRLARMEQDLASAKRAEAAARASGAAEALLAAARRVLELQQALMALRRAS
ncbi:MAG: DNA primase [Planctomycetota bacterium]|nr:DNA primase [Planctomycetota bacterium]